ncbi:MAG: type II secretion system F family protein [Planctomycetes bacterium]|nr:type II secretion system F family protein [Planctomycetota bacterium]
MSTALREKTGAGVRRVPPAAGPERAAAASKPIVSDLRARQSEVIMFTTQLSVMLDSGVVLTDALEAVSAQMRAGVFRDILVDVGARIKNGESFSEALSVYPKVFNAMFISMVKASEATGKMGQMLEVLSTYQNADAETRKQVKGAMIYPLIMLLMAIAATGSLMFFVLPRFTKIYESRGAALPALTRLLVYCSNLLANPEFMALVVTVATLGFWGISAWKKTESGQKTLDWIKIHIPIFGPMFIDAVLTRNMRILATMVNTGVNLLDALQVMRSSCDNYYFKSLWQHADAKIRDGCQFSDALMMAPYSHLIAPGIIQMLRAGEKSGKLGFACDRISIFLEKQLQNSIRTATALIEPLMITLMGLIIGTIAIALLLPVFRISSVMAH